MRLGDKVEKIIEKTIPKKILNKIKNDNCGCAKRKAYLNKF